MPQLMPLYWVFSNFILLVVCSVLIILYSCGDVSMGKESEFGADNVIMDWCW